MATTWWTTDGTIGADLENVTSSASVATGAPTFALGTIVKGNNASEWMYVYASAAAVAGGVVGVEASGTASPLLVAAARKASAIGFAQMAFSIGDYGWVALEGNGLTVATTGALASATVLFTSGTGGKLTTTAASTEAQLHGIRLTTTVSGTGASAAPAMVRNVVVVDQTYLI